MIKPVNLNSQEAKVMNKAKCPDCDAELDVPSDTEKGEIVSCPGCGLELEVKQTICTEVSDDMGHTSHCCHT